MFHEVVVGVDECEHGRDAIALARRLIGRGGHLTLAHVLTSDSYIYSGASSRFELAHFGRALTEREHDQALALLEDAAATAKLDDLDVEITPRPIRAATVGRGLHELADLQEADLLVVGSSRSTLLGRVWLGDDTRAALNGAPCAVAIAPACHAGQQPGVVREVGVGYDGSPQSEHALELGRKLAGAWEVRLSAFTAVAVPPTAFETRHRPLSHAVDALVTEARERIAALGGVEAHAAYGTAAEELTLYSASLDLLVVGSRGYGPLGRLIHGSTSAQLARTCRCPLLVLPRRAEVPEHDPDRANAEGRTVVCPSDFPV